MSESKQEPNDLVRSELFHQDPSEARELWRRGFRPEHAEDLSPGELVVFRETEPFAGTPVGVPLVAVVERVERDESIGEVEVHHSDGIVTTADEWDEVWAKEPSGGTVIRFECDDGDWQAKIGTEPRHPDVLVPMVGEDGNALAILGRVQRELRRAGVEQDEIGQFIDEATAGDYEHLLAVVQRWVEVS